MRGQALVEFALVAPLLCFLLLAVIEVGWFGARLIRWQQLAGAVAAQATDGTLPAWWASEASRAACGAPAASYEAGDPPRVLLSCDYAAIAVSGLGWRATVEAIVAPATPAPTQEVPSAEP